MRRRLEVELLPTGQVRVLVMEIDTNKITAEFWSVGEIPAVGNFVALVLENDAQWHTVKPCSILQGLSVPRIRPELPEDVL